MISLGTAASFFLAALLLGFAPGPDILFVLAQSAVHGPRAGLSTMCGLITGLIWHTGLVAAGVAALIVASPIAFLCLKILGSLYLIYLAVLSWKAGSMAAGDTIPAFPGCMALFRRGIIMNVTNPKVTVFFLAFLPQFCSPEAGNVALQCLQLGVLFALAAAVAFTTTSLLAGRILAKVRTSTKGQVIMNRACAVIFIVMAAALLMQHI